METVGETHRWQKENHRMPSDEMGWSDGRILDAKSDGLLVWLLFQWVIHHLL